MLPSIPTSLPQTPAPQPTGLGSSLALPTSQQITAVAVPGTGSPSPFSTQTQPQRANVPQRVAAQPDRAAILPDPEFWKVPTREANEMAAALPQRAPIQVNLPQISQFTAQVIAQQPAPPAAAAETAEEEIPVQRRTASSIPAKKPGVSNASGTTAYAVAAQRLTTISLSPAVEALS
jgi:hypothetical protein